MIVFCTYLGMNDATTTIDEIKNISETHFQRLLLFFYIINENINQRKNIHVNQETVQ